MVPSVDASPLQKKGDIFTWFPLVDAVSYTVVTVRIFRGQAAWGGQGIIILPAASVNLPLDPPYKANCFEDSNTVY